MILNTTYFTLPFVLYEVFTNGYSIPVYSIPSLSGRWVVEDGSLIAVNITTAHLHEARKSRIKGY